jgi:hypothetical protein
MHLTPQAVVQHRFHSCGEYDPINVDKSFGKIPYGRLVAFCPTCGCVRGSSFPQELGCFLGLQNKDLPQLISSKGVDAGEQRAAAHLSWLGQEVGEL